jgi:hypothetical protein
MKILKQVFLTTIVALSFMACDSDENENIGLGESINDFKLIGPTNFTTLELNPGTPTKSVIVSWEAAKTGLNGTVTYRFLLDENDGDFSSPLLAVASDNDGSASTVTLTTEQLLQVIEGMSASEFKWNVEAKTVTAKGENTVVSSTPFTLTITASSVGISDFGYETPSLNEKLLLDGIRTADEEIVFSWTPATSTQGDVNYNWVAATSPNGFDEPVLTFQSDDNGASPTFSRTHEEWIEILNGIEYTDGLYWRVEASVDGFVYSPESRFVWFEVFDIPNLFIVGSFQGWSNTCEAAISMTNKGGGVFESLINIPANSEFKLVLACGSWDVAWGSPNNDPIVSGQEYELGGNNIKVSEASSYFVRADFSNSVFKLTQFVPPADMFLVGGSTSADWNPANSIKFIEKETNTFEMFAYIDAAGGGFKFLQVQDWAGDWGAKGGTRSVDNGVITGGLVQEGEDNVTVDNAGFYRITLNYNTQEYKLEPMSFGIIGSARTGDDSGWGADDDMIFVGSKGSYKWTITTTLFNGQLKFRANDDWAVNFGDDSVDGSLEYGGANLNIAAGTYKIDLILDPITGYTYEITLQ